MTPGEEPTGSDEPTATPGLQRLLDRLNAEHQFDFREYKVTSLARRIQTRIAQAGVDSEEAYMAFLDAHPEEAERLFNTILINVTGFFRDPPAWSYLAEHVVPRLVETAAATRSIRVWSAGCASGEEAYSIVMLLAERLGAAQSEMEVKIYGTDIDDEALASARNGLYRLEQLKDVPPPLLERYFVRDGQLYRFRRDLRRWCIFGRHNLVNDPPLSHFDLVVCRNVLIYLKTGVQQRILPRFHFALRGRGVLFLGKSESLLARSRWFTPLSAKWRIFERTLLEAARAEPATLRAESEATAREMARDRLAAAPLPVERVLERLPFAVMVIEPDDTIRSWNRAAAQLFEIPVEHAVGRKFRELDISYRAEGFRARIEESKSTGAPIRLDDLTFVRRSGLAVHAAVHIVPLADTLQVNALLVAAVDITEHARLQDEIARVSEQHATATEELQSTNEELETTNEELQSTNEELLATVDELQATNVELQRLALYHASVVQSVDQAIVVLDHAFTVTSWNPAAEGLWKLSAAEAVGRDFFTLPIGSVIEAARGAIRKIQAGGGVAVDVPFTAPGESARSLLRLLPLTAADGRLAGVLALTPSRERTLPA